MIAGLVLCWQVFLFGFVSQRISWHCFPWVSMAKATTANEPAWITGDEQGQQSQRTSCFTLFWPEDNISVEKRPLLAASTDRRLVQCFPHYRGWLLVLAQSMDCPTPTTWGTCCCLASDSKSFCQLWVSLESSSLHPMTQSYGASASASSLQKGNPVTQKAGASLG